MESWSDRISVHIRKDNQDLVLFPSSPLPSPLFLSTPTLPTTERPSEKVVKKQLSANQEESSPETDFASTLIIDF